ncbi:protein-methionine-sulfoxide reductase catalytic subunit MsrP, partial [Cupriavidus gilardii]|nr:protein-methionine-sulfoxide reductase catalytic subunit MsrP [Cupriavidus gilardii]
MWIPSPKWLRGDDIPPSEITPPEAFAARRRWLAMVAAGAAGSTLAP